MPGLYRDEGVVLRTIKLGEADRIVTVLTQGHGKVRAVAKGVRKTSSRFGARLEPMSRVALQCYRGRELDIVTQAETLEANRVLREEYGLLTHAIPMLEAVDQVAQEHEPNPALYRMLTGQLPFQVAPFPATLLHGYFVEPFSRQLEIAIMGKLESGKDVSETGSFTIAKGIAPKLVGITVKGSGSAQTVLEIGDW